MTGCHNWWLVIWQPHTPLIKCIFTWNHSETLLEAAGSPSETTRNDDIRPMFDVHNVDDVQRPMYDDSQPMSDVHSTGDDKGDRCGSAQVPGSPDALKNLENLA